ncbi:CsgG/HfaB family protein [Inhella gelatinilytica]|uniref:Lipoprotein n=1 Tax=Inhella gelatinilytica TaxID=2795030 RepID=A0A931J071_9BURK|nr:CsgG/HfaB family protein [Inhella gelatinilytica]MBH9553783.1 hypothetical protein [Inhella gelatinilytica]
MQHPVSSSTQCSGSRQASKRLPLLALLGAIGFGALSPAQAQEGNPSPTAGSSYSQDANRRADQAKYAPIEYANASKPGPKLIVLPGEIKASNASFTQKVTPTNIADFAEIELTRANFVVLERSDLGPLLREVELAYQMGDPQQSARLFQKGKLSATKWLLKFDVLKAEPVASSGGGISGGTAARLLSIFGRTQAAHAGAVVADSVRTDEQVQVWLVGLRYKILDANTSEQVANGYIEDKLETGRTSTSVAGISSNAAGGLGLDSLVQRLVQRSVAEIDARYK